MNALRRLIERGLRERILAVLREHVAPDSNPAGMEQVGPFTLMWGRHRHSVTQQLHASATPYCRCGAACVGDEWYLPEAHIRAAQEAVIDSVLLVLGEPTLIGARIEQALTAARKPGGGVVGEPTLITSDDSTATAHDGA